MLSILYNGEWSMPFPQGHTNTVFPTRHNYKMNGKTGATNTLHGGWEFLRRGGYKAITIPHTPADPGMGTTWPAYDPQYMRLCEIFQSCRGSYEHDGCPRQHVNATNKKGFYWNALEKGYQLGIICSQRPRLRRRLRVRLRQGEHARSRLAGAVRPPDLRLDDLRPRARRPQRRALDGRGVRVSRTRRRSTSTSAARRRSARSRSSAARKVLHAEGSVEKPIDAAEHRLSWTDPEWAQQTGEQWYYVRVIQEDDEMAWSSPMWVKKP